MIRPIFRMPRRNSSRRALSVLRWEQCVHVVAKACSFRMCRTWYSADGPYRSRKICSTKLSEKIDPRPRMCDFKLAKSAIRVNKCHLEGKFGRSPLHTIPNTTGHPDISYYGNSRRRPSKTDPQSTTCPHCSVAIPACQSTQNEKG